MKFKAINTLSIKELFISQIEEMILSGELKPGDKLPTERELADEMNISKTIVHDGIRELARIGFLDVISRKGIYVADYTFTGNLETLLAVIRYRGDTLDPKNDYQSSGCAYLSGMSGSGDSLCLSHGR